jgi:hypothetical protein
MDPKSRKSVRSLKSWLFTPGTKADHFEKAAEGLTVLFPARCELMLPSQE